MHIVLVSHYAPPHLGGIGFVATQLSQRLASRGHRVTMVTSDASVPAGIYRHGRETHIAVRSTNALENYDIPYPVFDPLELGRVFRNVLPSADIVHAHGMLFMSTAMATAMATRRGIPVLLTEHVGRIPYKGATDRVQAIAIWTLGRYCYHRATAVTYLNQRVGSDIEPLLPADAHTSKIPNGVDTERFHPVDAKRKAALRRKWGFEKPTALFVGRFARRKGIDLLLEAAHEEFELVFCGANGGATIDENKLRVIPPLEQDELSELYQACDVLVLPSVGEGFPLVVQEAMASGLPVVVTDSNEYREYLDETVAVFTPREPSAIRDNVLALVRPGERRAEMGRAARRWSLDHFDWERTVDQYLELYARHRSPRD